MFDEPGRGDENIPASDNNPEIIVAPAIPEIVVPAENRLLQFSFRHLDTANQKFQLADCNAEFLQHLLGKIKL